MLSEVTNELSSGIETTPRVEGVVHLQIIEINGYIEKHFKQLGKQ